MEKLKEKEGVDEMAREFEKEARIFTDAIRKLARNENNLDNLEGYLSFHFDTWLKHYANTPMDMASEINCFANMDDEYDDGYEDDEDDEEMDMARW